MKIQNLKQLKENVSRVCACLEEAGFDLTKIPIDFLCNDRSEGTVVQCEQIDSMVFDLIAEPKDQKIKIEIS